MKAFLLLADGTLFEGVSLGAAGTAIGEVVFATGMVGFEETLTDPSYYGQIITQTYPLIGNYGMNREDKESPRVWARGYIVRESCRYPSNFRSEQTLDAFLKQEKVVAIEGIDTRRLTRILRSHGVMNGAVTTEYTPETREELLAAIRGYAITGAVKAVTCTEPRVYGEGGKYKVALLDFGCKNNIVRCLVKRGCEVTVLPGFATAADIKALGADGVMLSNGPGDPAENLQIIENLRAIMELGLPVFGICLGHQLSALAAGASTGKLKFGHRGANQPVTDLARGRTLVTSQNHGYAVLGDTLPAEMGKVSHVNANDGTCEGVEYTAWNCFTVQFHPEASGGPKDAEYLFDEFVSRIAAAKGGC